VAPARLSPRQQAVDIALAVGFAAVFLGYTALLFGSKTLHLPWLAGAGMGSLVIDLRIEVISRTSIALVAASAVALAFRRRHPAASFLAICGVGCVQVALGEPISLWNVAMPLALLSAAAYAGRGFARVALFLALAAYVGIWVIETGLLGRLDRLPNPLDVLTTGRGAAFVVMFALLVVVWAIGDQVRARRERFEYQLERAAQLQREQDANARIGALAERHRIARELHDVVAHGLSVMIVQADGARYAEAEHPEAPREALATIAATGRESLAEMRRLLGVLRDDPDAAQLAPQPDLGAVPGLIERFRAAGLDVDYRVEGPARPVPPAVGLTAYRIVQESLTNVLHHAGATRVQVRVSFAPYALGIVVANDPGPLRPPPSPEPGRGLGLLGMRERVALLGGRMAAGPTAAGGFVVQVEIAVVADGLRRAAPGPWGTSPAADFDAAGAAERPA
jgi:signal transduction histidine kinase